MVMWGISVSILQNGCFFRISYIILLHSLHSNMILYFNTHKLLEDSCLLIQSLFRATNCMGE